MKTSQDATAIVLITALVGCYIYFGQKYFLYVGLVIGLLAIFIPSLFRYIHDGWMLLARKMNSFFSPIIFGAIYFCVLTPISFIWKMAKSRNNKNVSTFEERNHVFEAHEMEKMW